MVFISGILGSVLMWKLSSAFCSSGIIAHPTSQPAVFPHTCALISFCANFPLSFLCMFFSVSRAAFSAAFLSRAAAASIFLCSCWQRFSAFLASVWALALHLAVCASPLLCPGEVGRAGGFLFFEGPGLVVPSACGHRRSAPPVAALDVLSPALPRELADLGSRCGGAVGGHRLTATVHDKAKAKHSADGETWRDPWAVFLAHVTVCCVQGNTRARCPGG
mmetsp:Transcript_14547/g.40948  ORF Transcript_14547/g.40948 Transcript_14547/m.40948 type:complete len:220 (+) Transcript_14547:852-1511(+)